MLGLNVLACGHGQRAPTPNPSAAVSVSAAAASVPVRGAAPAPLVSAAVIEPRAPVQHCKALGKVGSATLGSINEDDVQLLAQGDVLFALGYTYLLARTRLYRASRAGGRFEPIAEQKGVGYPTHFALLNGAAYYTQSGQLFKLGPEQGTALKLADGVHSPAAVTQGFVFVIACDSKSSDHLLQIPTAGGPAETLAELPRASHDLCRYASIVADEHALFVADWNGARVLAVSRADKSVTPIVTKRTFPAALRLDSTGLSFTSSLGVFHVGRQGESLTRLVADDIALAPYARTATYADELWVFDDTAYATSCNLYRVSYSEPEPKPFLQLHNTDPNGSTADGFGLADFTVDDECVYVAQTQYAKRGVQIFAKAK